jgi:triacylglycerol lipase
MSSLRTLLVRLTLFATILAAPAIGAAQASGAPPSLPRLTTARATGPASTHRPVIFVHGLGSDELNLWFLAIAHFKTQGYTPGDITVIQYVSMNGALPASAQLATEVDWLIAHTGKPKVDIVSHSFGSLVTKHCIVEGGCQGKVARWESLAGAQNGTHFKRDASAAAAPSGPSVADLEPDSALVKRLQETGEAALRAQGVAMQVQWTPGDQAVVPPMLSKEGVADNVELSPLVTHQSILFDASVIQRTCAFLQR